MTEKIKNLLVLYRDGKNLIVFELNNIDDIELFSEVEENILNKINFYINILEDVLNGNVTDNDNINKSFSLSEKYYNNVLKKILTDLNI